MKRALLVLGATALAVGGPSFADAATKTQTKHKKKNHAFTLVVSTAGIQPQGNAFAGRQVYAGIEDGSIGGHAAHGAVRGVNNYTGLTFQGTNTSFTALGTTNATLTGTGTPNADGSIAFKGTGLIVGGTGVYKGATGKFTFQGTEAKGSTVPTYTVGGTIKY